MERQRGMYATARFNNKMSNCSKQRYLDYSTEYKRDKVLLLLTAYIDGWRSCITTLKQRAVARGPRR